jgi:c-di-GMP-binding flagellar brake protein YcgR
LFTESNGYRIVNRHERDGIPRQPVNLSGGGMRTRIFEFVNPGTRLSANLVLPVSEPHVIHVAAEVVRCSEILLSWDKFSSYLTAMKFICIDEKDREKIINFIFCEQRNRLGTGRKFPI